MATARPLTPLEHLLAVDRRAGYPMAFYIHCDVEGRLLPDRLATALRSAAARHALPRSRLGGWWRPRWLPPDRQPEFVALPRGSNPVASDPWSPASLRRASGMRMVALEGSPNSWRVVLQVQHAVCDGLAAIEFFGDVWAHYHGSEPTPFRAPSRRARGGGIADDGSVDDAPDATTDRTATQATRQLVDRAGRFAACLPAVLARGPAASGDAATGSEDGLWPGPPAPYLTCSFTTSETATIKQLAAAAGASLNDVVVAAVMRVACAWNEAAGMSPQTVRITMPVSLKPAGMRGPATNAMGYAFLDRSASECRRRAELVASLADASRWIQETRAVQAFLDALGACDRVPGLLWLLTRTPLPMSTAVVSYVGNAGPRMRANVPRDGGCDRPGGLRITSVAGVPPVRPGTRLAVGLVIYDGRLQLSTLCDTRTLGPAAAPLLQALVRTEVMETASALAAAAPPR